MSEEERITNGREWIDRSIIQGKKKGEWVLDGKGEWVWLDSIEGS